MGPAVLEAPHLGDVRVLADVVLEDLLATREAIGTHRRDHRPIASGAGVDLVERGDVGRDQAG
jgi:hypothetical protein